jgi:hypothetical protein
MILLKIDRKVQFGDTHQIDMSSKFVVEPHRCLKLLLAIHSESTATTAFAPSSLGALAALSALLIRALGCTFFRRREAASRLG